MKTVFFYYNPTLKDLYWEDESIIFFDDHGWWIIEDGTRSVVPPHKLVEVSDYFTDVVTAEIIQELRSWGPVWARWHCRGDQQELALRSALLLVLAIASGLKKLNVDVCVMHTGVSHHVDSVIFQTACHLVCTKTIFLYCEVFAARLIPLLQNGGIEERLSITHKISDFIYEKELQDFIKTKKNGLPPKNNIKVSGFATSWKYAVPYLFCKDVVALMRLLKKKLDGKKQAGNVFNFDNGFYPFQFTVQALQQKNALKYLKGKIKNIDSFRDQAVSLNSPVLIIAAHFQPEATSFPEGGKWGNHIDIALEIFKKGYQGPLLYKEHPATSLYLEGRNSTRVGMSRSRQYYEQLERLGCEYIDTEFKLSIDPSENYWYLPVTITGTIAIERALAGFCTVVTGYPWFKGMPGILHISDIETLDAINPEWTRPNSILAAQAFEYLDKYLSGKTIRNVPGIGTGVPLTKPNDKAAFATEFNNLLSLVRAECWG